MRGRVQAIGVAILTIIIAAAGNSTAAVAAAKTPRLIARSELGAGDARNPVPQAPFITGVIAEGLAVLANWTPLPPSDHVTSYKLAAGVDRLYRGHVGPGCSTPPTTSAPASDSSALVGHLCPAIPYVITVRAMSSAGTGTRSKPSNPVAPLPAQPPSAPLILSVLARNDSLVVAWSAPALAGGDPVTGYKLVASASGRTIIVRPGATAVSATIGGLSNSTTYQVSLTARSKAGSSAAAQGSGTPSAAYPPGQPQSLRVVPSGTGALVTTWSAPSDDGGDAITSYDITYRRQVPNGAGGWVNQGPPISMRAAGTATTARITRVARRNFYAVSVAAVSAAGTGAAATTSTPVTPTTGLSPNAVILTAATIRALIADHGGTLIWPARPPAQVRSLLAGSVLVAGMSPRTPKGLLVKVISVSHRTRYVVRTTAANVTDAVTNISAAFSGLPPNLASAQIAAVAPGIRVVARPAGAIHLSPTFVLSIALQGGPNNRDQVTGSLSINPDLSLDLEVNQGFLGIPDGITFAASASIKTGFQGVASLTGVSHTWQITRFQLPSFDLQLGPLPLVITPQVPIMLTAAGKISLGFRFSAAVGAGMSWSSSDPGSLGTYNLSQAPSLTGAPIPGVAASATASLTVGVSCDVEVDGVAGPEVEADLIFNAVVNFNPSPTQAWFEIAPSVALKVGLNVSFNLGPLSFDKDFTVTLATVTFPLYETLSVPHADLTITPANPAVLAGKSLQLRTVRSDSQSFAVTWILQGGISGDSLSQNGVLTVAAPGGRTLTILAVDSTGVAGQATVAVDGTPDAPGNLTARVDGNGTSAVLSWTRPANTGGFPLASYVVITQPSTATYTVKAPATGIQLSGLQLQSSYLVSVYAVNSGGLTSSAASVFLGTPVPGAVLSAKAVEAPLPPDANKHNIGVPFPNADLFRLSCGVDASCIAVGTYVDNQNFPEPRALIETLANGTWAPRKAPLPAHANTTENAQSYLDGLSCTPSGDCVAVGEYQTVPYGLAGLIETRSNGVWRATRAPSLPNAVTYYDTALLSVSCASPSWCVAVGYYYDKSAHQHSLIETLSHGLWRPTRAPLPANSGNVPKAIEDHLLGLNAVDCPAVGNCVAIGTYYSRSGSYQGLIERLAGGVWRPAQAPVPADANKTPNVTFDQFVSACAPSTKGQCAIAVCPSSGACGTSLLTCPEKGNCVTVGSYYNRGGGLEALIETLSNGAWRPLKAPVPTVAGSGGSQPLLFSDACVAAGLCLAVGEYFDSSFNLRPLIETLSRGGWRPTAGPIPVNGAPNLAALGSIACKASGACVAAGLYTKPGGASQALIETLTGSVWAAREGAVPANASKNSPGAAIGDATACVASGPCLATGVYTDSAKLIEGLIETVNLAGS